MTGKTHRFPLWGGLLHIPDWLTANRQLSEPVDAGFPLHCVYFNFYLT